LTFHDNQRSFGDASKQLQTAHRNSSFSGLIKAVGKTKEKFIQVTPFLTAEQNLVNGNDFVEFKIDSISGNDEKILKIEQLIAMFVKKLESYKPSDETCVCSIVIPETFSEVEQKALFTACEISGINCEQLIYRTTAAAITNATRKSSFRTRCAL